MPLASDCMRTAPIMAPAMVPMPPPSDVPPMTAAAMTSSSSSVPMALVAALRRAVEMAPGEQSRRMRFMRRQVADKDVAAWARSFLAAVDEARADRGLPPRDPASP